jgi:glutathione S-transferase
VELTFIYFDIPFWRSEVGKIALFLGDVEFENKKITGEEFQRVKENGHLDDGTIIPFHQFPCLIVDGVSIAQTGGIARFCGKLSNMYPSTNDILAAQIDQYLDIATDITVLVSSAGGEKDDEKRRIMRQEMCSGALGRKLQILDKNIADDSEWVLGQGMSLADIAIWRLMGWLSSGMLDGIPTNLLAGYPKISRVCSAVDMNPRIQEWVSQTYPQNYNRGNYL